jgi:hypothetical protein
MNLLPNQEQLLTWVKSAVRRFNRSADKRTLLCEQEQNLQREVKPFRIAHEQVVAHRLAFYLESRLRREKVVNDKGVLAVDCEYNKHLQNRKIIRVRRAEVRAFLEAGRAARRVPGMPGIREFEIRPDIIVHRRGHDRPTNLLIVEVKRWTNRERPHDQQKLKLLTEVALNPFGYVLGVAVYIRNDLTTTKRKLEIGPKFHAGLPF